MAKFAENTSVGADRSRAEKEMADLIPRTTVAAALAALRGAYVGEGENYHLPYSIIAFLDATIAELGLVIHEDQLPETLSQTEYSEWFAASWIQDGVRVGFPITEEAK